MFLQGKPNLLGEYDATRGGVINPNHITGADGKKGLGKMKSVN